MVNVGQAVGYLTLDKNPFSAGLKSAGQDLNSFMDKTKSGEDRVSALGSVMTATGGMLTKSVTMPMLGIGAATVMTAATFQEGMSTVQAISGASGADMELLSQKAKDMGSKTKFSASQAAEALGFMGMAGWDAGQMIGGLEGVMNLAAASGENLGTVSDIVTDAMTAFGLSADKSGKFADVLASASAAANTNVSMLGESFKYVAPIAGAMGYSVEDTSVALGLMANAGVKASQAGTTLRGALTRLAKPTDDAAALMEKYGLSITDGSGNMKSLDTVMGDLRKSLGGLTEAEQIQVATTLFGQEAMSGMLAIVNASEKDYNKLSSAIANSEGSAKKMAEIMQNNLKGSLTKIKSAVEGAAISIGERLIPMLSKMADKIQSAVDWFNGLSDSTKDNIVKFGLYAAAAGPVISVTGKMVGTASKLVGVGVDVAKTLGLMSTATTAVTGATVTATTGVGALTSGIGFLSAGVLPLTVGVGALAAGFYVWHEAVDVANQKVTKSREEMSFTEKVIADLTGKVTYSKDELVDMGLAYEDFNENISPEFQESVKAMTTDIHEFGANLGQINLDEVISPQEHADFVSRVDGALKGAVDAIDSNSSKMQSGLNGAFSLDGIIDENETVLLNWWDERGTKEKAEAQKLHDEIKNIEITAFKEGRALTPEEVASIEERYAQIRQIELEAQANNTYEIEYAHKDFQNRMKTLDAEGAQELLSQRAKQRNEEQIEISTKYDALIAMAEQNYENMSVEEKKFADDTKVRLEKAKNEELDISESYYEEDYRYALEHNENIRDVINKYTGEIIERKDLAYYQQLVQADEHYEEINKSTKTGYHRLKNTITGTYDDVYVMVDETTGRLVGTYNYNTQELGAMTKEDAKLLRQELNEWELTEEGALRSCLAMGNGYVDLEGNIRNSSNEIVGKLNETKDANGNVTRSIETLNGTPIDIGDNAPEVTKRLLETNKAVDNLDGEKAEVEVTDNGTAEQTKSGIKAWFANPITQTINVVKRLFGGDDGYATGTFSAMAGYKMVGENGPEIVKLAGGERIYNAIESQRIAHSMNDTSSRTIDNSAINSILNSLEKVSRKLEEIPNSKREINLNIQEFNNNRELDIENLAHELAFYEETYGGGR